MLNKSQDRVQCHWMCAHIQDRALSYWLSLFITNINNYFLIYASVFTERGWIITLLLFNYLMIQLQWQQPIRARPIVALYSLLCKRPGCYHCTRKTHVTDRIFKSSPMHASVIISFPEFTEFSEISAPFRKTSMMPKSHFIF